MKGKHRMKHIALVVPSYNEEECVSLLYERVREVFEKETEYDFSILYVNDGSKDHTLEEILKLEKKYGSEKVKYISFARNFGKESAIYAGLSSAEGDYIVLMDADLQHPPELLPEMARKLDEGYDCCGARRVDRKGEPPIRSALSRLFYKLINKMTNMNMVQGGSDFRMMTAQMAEAMTSLGERERFTKGIFSWVGFDTTWIEYENVERAAGTTKWSFGGLVRYALSGFISFATAPLRLAVYLGFFIVFVAFIYAITIFVAAIGNGAGRTGYSTIVLLLLFFGGVIILLLGIIGEYMARMYMEMKHRPIFIVKKSNCIEVKNGRYYSNHDMLQQEKKDCSMHSVAEKCTENN